MRYSFLILLLVLSLSACSFDVEMVTPPPASTTVPVFMPSSTPPADALTPLPAFTSTPFITPLPLQAGSSDVFRVQFPPNGTYAFVEDGLLAGGHRTYVVNAMRGQVMSISVRLAPFSNWTVIPMTILGADGSILCPRRENEACYYWRGNLPSTQDYLVTLRPETDVPDFIVKVAVNPPGVATQSFLYESADKRVMLFYNDEFAPVLLPEMYISKLMPELTLQFIDSGSIDDTNLSEAYFLFGVSNDPGIVGSCTQAVSLGGMETITGEVNIGGVPFTRSEAVGLGAGNAYEQTYYRTAYNGSCYEVTFFVHSTNIGNYPPELGVKEFDRDALISKMEGVLSTLVIK